MQPQTQVNANTQLVLNESTATDAPVRALFQQGRTLARLCTGLLSLCAYSWYALWKLVA